MDPYKVSTGVLSVIVVAISIAALMKDRMGTLPAVETTGAKEFSYIMVLFLPHILMVFGFIADALSQDIRYSIPSIAGFISIFLNYGFGIFFEKLSSMMSSPPPAAIIVGGGIDTTGCYIPGFESIVSNYSSAPLVVTFTIMIYYMLDLIQNRGFFSSISTVISMVAFVAAQFFVLRANGCFEKFSSVGVPLATSGLLGLLFGGVTYGVIQSTAPGRLPSAVYSPDGPSASTPESKPSGGGGGKCSGGKCGAPADDDQFVCDSYINGLQVTT